MPAPPSPTPGAGVGDEAAELEAERGNTGSLDGAAVGEGEGCVKEVGGILVDGACWR